MGLLAISVPTAVLAGPASASDVQVIIDKKLTKSEARAHSADLRNAAVMAAPYCGSKIVQKFSPQSNAASKVVWAFAGADPCKVVKVFTLTSEDLERRQSQKPHFRVTVERNGRRFRPHNCIMRLTVANTTQTVSVPGKGVC